MPPLGNNRQLSLDLLFNRLLKTGTVKRFAPRPPKEAGITMMQILYIRFSESLSKPLAKMPRGLFCRQCSGVRLANAGQRNEPSVSKSGTFFHSYCQRPLPGDYQRLPAVTEDDPKSNSGGIQTQAGAGNDGRGSDRAWEEVPAT